jgi:hypothetical protein
MLLEIKTGAITLTTLTLALPLFLLQVPTNGLDFFQIADKVGVIGILLYMSYTLNKRMETMFASFQTTLKEEREKSDKIQSDLIQKVIELATKQAEK